MTVENKTRLTAGLFPISLIPNPKYGYSEMKMLQYTLIKDIEPEKIKPCLDDFAIEYNSPGGEPETALSPAFYPPILLKERKYYYILMGKCHIDYYLQKHLPLPFGLAVERSGSTQEMFQHLIQVKKQLYGFNAVEKAHALKKYLALRKSKESDASALLDIPNSKSMLQKYLLLAEVSDHIKSLILMRTISEFTVFEIFQFDRNEWDDVASFVGSLPIGTRKRNEVVTMLFDITRRDKKNIEGVLNEEMITSILNSHIDAPQKGEQVYGYLYSLRYPRIHEYRKQFFQLLQESGIERFAHLEVPRDFEKWRFKIGFSFSSIDEFRKKILYLSETANARSLKELFNMRSLYRH